MPTLTIEPFGGMAGDMFLAALLDLGDPRFGLDDLSELAEALVPGQCRLELTRVRRGSIAAAHLDVVTDESSRPPHRHLSDLRKRVETSGLAQEVQRRSMAVLTRLAEAEGRVHGIAPEEVHFHEVGAVDTLIDVCGAALALERLGVERVLSTPPLTGEGSVSCAHGEMPVPVPAVVELLQGSPLHHGGGPGERLTPTGAAILAEYVERWQPGGGVVVVSEAVGYGAGTREPQTGPPNLVRVQLVRAAVPAAEPTEAWLLEVHLDDATGEELGWCLAALREAGALDAWSTPIQMKKDRPGVQLSALARAADRARLEAVVFERTPSLGLRWIRVERTECQREERVVLLDGIAVRVKLRHRPDYPDQSAFGERDLFPEYEDLLVLAKARDWSLREAERRVVARLLEELG